MRLPFIVAVLAVIVGCEAPALSPPQVNEFVFYSDTYEIDRIYRSMKGPKSVKQVQILGDALEPELIWIVGYRTEIVGPASDDVLSPEFMCHNNLNFADLDQHRKYFDWDQGNPRLFTLSQGQMDVRFPPGFGIPIHSHQRFAATTQVLNLNPQEHPFGVRHKTTLSFVRDRETDGTMQALYQTAAQGLVSLSDPGVHFNMHESEGVEGPGCAAGQIAGERVIKDRFGREFAAHWVVPPGREVHRTVVSGYLGLTYDTTVHYIAVHLHPFAESLELRDLTSDESLFKSKTESPADKIGLSRVEHFASAAGIPIHKDHTYELVSVYDNTSGTDQDAMAVMFMYLHDKDFKRPEFD